MSPFAVFHVRCYGKNEVSDTSAAVIDSREFVLAYFLLQLLGKRMSQRYSSVSKSQNVFAYQKLSEAKLADELVFEVWPLQRL